MSDNNYRMKNLTISNVLGEGFNLFFHNIKKMSAPAFWYGLLAVVLPCLFLLPFLIRFPFFMGNIENIDNMNENEAVLFMLSFMAKLIPFYLLIIVESLFLTTFLSMVATIRSSELYLKREIRPMLQVIKEEKSLYFPLLAFSFLIGLVTSGGYAVFIIPGIVITILLYILLPVMMPVFILERKSISDTIKRTWELTKGKKVDIVVIQFISSFLIQSISGVLMVVPMFIMYAILGGAIYLLPDLYSGGNEYALIAVIYIFAIVFMIPPSVILTTITVSLQHGFTTSIYYNILKDTEGFSTEHLATSFLSDEPSSNGVE